MTPESPVIAELRILLDALCEETITPEQLRRLEDLVLNHPEAEAHYIQFMSFYADLIGHIAGLPQRPPVAPNRPAPRRDEPKPVERNTSPNQSPPQKEKPMPRSRTRWELAAALLFVVGGLGTLAAFQFSGWYGKSRDAAEKQRALDAARGELTRLQAEQKAAEQAARKDIDAATEAGQKLLKEYQAEIEKARKDVEAKDFMVRLTGPAHIQPGAPNKWQIETLRHGQIARPKKLEIIVKDAKDAELFRQTDDKPVGAATLELPTSFWEKVKPGSDLFLEVVAYTGEDRKSVLAEKLPLARPVYVTHLATDKPLYKPGEVIRFRSLTLDRATLKPPANDVHLKFNLRDPAGAVVTIDEGNGRVLNGVQTVLGPDKKPLRGLGVGDYTLSPDAPGGEYKLELSEVVVNNHEVKEVLLETRKFIVNRYVPDVFEKKLEFDGKSYGPGDAVQARVEVSRTAGGPMTNATATVVASIDGKTISEEKGQKFAIGADNKAVLNVRFKLPADLFETAKKDTPPNATLSVSIQDGSDAENILRPVPLVTKTLLVEFFPEGGDMVAGVPGRVYFQVRTPAGKPADVRGIITDGTSLVADVGEVKTETDAENEGVNRGHGVFTLTPKAGAKYFLKLASPSGITAPTKDGFPLPEVKADGVVLRALDSITDKGGAIRVRVDVAQGKKTLHVGAYARGRLIAHQKIEAEAGKPVELALRGDEAAGGVTRVTVFEEPRAEGPGRALLIPRAERLVYRKPGEQLLLNVNPDKARYSPAGKVRLELSAYNEKEQPTPAVLLVAVVNRSVITMADNKTDRLMPTHFLLSGDVKHPAELEHADFLLTDHPKAAVALDLLLGTQGWRRFAEQNGAPANLADKAEVDRMLVAHGQRTTAPLELFLLVEQAISNDFRPKVEQARLQITSAQEALNASRVPAGSGLGGQVAAAQAALTAADKEYTEAAAQLYRNETRPLRAGTWGLPALVLGLFGLAIGGMALAGSRPSGSRQPYFMASIALFALGIVATGGVVMTRGTEATAKAWKQLNPFEDTSAEMSGDIRLRGVKGQNAAPDAAGGAMPEWLDAAQPMDRADMPKGGAGMPRPGNAFPVTINPKLDPAAKSDPKWKVGSSGPDDVKNLDKLLASVEKMKRNQEDLRARADKPGKGDADFAPRVIRRPFPAGQPGMGMGGRIGAGDIGPGIGLPGGGFPGGGMGQPFGEMAQFGNHIAQVSSFVVREYAHQRDSSLGEVRADFTETVYWHPVLVLPDSGKTTIEFQLADDIARYQVLVAGHTTDGRISAITKTIESRKPFSLDPKIPLEISHTDTVDVPVRVVNDSDDRRNVAFNVTLKGLKSDANLRDTFDLGPNGKSRKVFRLNANQLQGNAGLMIDGSSGADKDTIVRTLRVVPDGFPGVGSFSDMIEKRAAGSVTLPKDLVPGSLKVRLEVYPTSMADLVKGLEGLLMEPYGCFEQTSTTNYPNTLILDYMNQTNQANPEVAKRAKDLLAKGYGRLTSFECPDTPEKRKQGFEWFGAADMQHEALTAYGLLQFKDMARVSPVDPALIKRTQEFLLSRRDGNGGFRQNPKSYHTWGASKEVVNAYIVWALVESDPDDKENMDLRKEIAALKRQALDENSAGGKDSYFVALVANVLIQRGEREAAHKLLDRLQEKHTKGGRVTGAVTSVTCSGGQALEIETTAFAMLGWMRANDPKYVTTVKEATRWISQQRGGHGGFGSTQSTIMALKALILYAKKSAHPAESGEIQVSIGGKQVAARKFTDKDVEVIGLDIEKPEEFFKFGAKTEVEIATDAKQAYPFALSYTYTTLTPVSAEKCAVQITTKLGRAEANEGDTVPLSVTLENRQKQGQGMAVAIVGIPAGMKVPTDMKQLTELREQGTVSYFELRDRELILYWRELKPEQKIPLTVDLVCDVPGVYRGPASRGYLYYNADHKHWVEPLSIKIAPLADAK